MGPTCDIVRNYCKVNGIVGYAKATALNIRGRVSDGKACVCCGKAAGLPVLPEAAIGFSADDPVGVPGLLEGDAPVAGGQQEGVPPGAERV